jgi:DNA-binding CsgD family transcriptional regulator
MGNIDTSSELHIYRFGNGIKLIRNEDTIGNSSHIGLVTQQTIGSLLQLPLSVYFIDANSINQKVNEHDANLSGFNSVKEAVGKTCFSNLTKKSANITTSNDKEVMQSHRIKISEEDVFLSKTNLHRPTLSIKMPWYNDKNKVIGLFGCSIILGKHPLADSLSLIKNIGLLNTIENPSNFVGTEINNAYLSKQQLSCAKLILSGMTLRKIAEQLNLSPRTVEKYIEIIKTKLHCRNKTELIIRLTTFINKQ